MYINERILLSKPINIRTKFSLKHWHFSNEVLVHMSLVLLSKKVLFFLPHLSPFLSWTRPLPPARLCLLPTKINCQLQLEIFHHRSCHRGHEHCRLVGRCDLFVCLLFLLSFSLFFLFFIPPTPSTEARWCLTEFLRLWASSQNTPLARDLSSGARAGGGRASPSLSSLEQRFGAKWAVGV